MQYLSDKSKFWDFKGCFGKLLRLLGFGLILFIGFPNLLSAQEPLKIACVGNSITYGAMVVNREKNAYSAQLQEILGNGYEVENFGVNGRTLLKKGDLSYWETDAYNNALNFEPDLVFIMLGTNDSKLQNRVHLDEFEADYTELIEQFRNGKKRPRIVLLLPIPSFLEDSTSIWDPVIKDQIIPKIQKVAYDTKSEVLDLYQLFIDKPEFLVDKIHPTGLGATVIAKRLYESVLQKTSPPLNLSSSKAIGSIKHENFYGFPLSNFTFNGWECKIVQPKIVAPGNPWVLRARFFGHEPQADVALLERGFHIAYCDVSDLYGGKEAVNRWNSFYKLMISIGLSNKVVLEGMSRGGLIIYNWAAENPEKVACIYADAPVLDGKSWPGGMYGGKESQPDWERFKKVYGLKNETDVESFKGNPISKTDIIAKAGFPMLHVVGETDVVVPISENTLPFQKMIKEEGSQIETIIKPNNGHHPHSLKNPTPIVDFILRATDQKINFAEIPVPSAEYRSGAGWTEDTDWWAQAHDIDSICRANPSVDLLLIGNSITQGWGNRPHTTMGPGKKTADQSFKGLKWINAGISGDRTGQVLYRLLHGKYEACNPKTIVLTIGVNNFNDNDSASEIAEGISQIVRVLKKKFSSDTKILLFGPLPTGIESNSERRKKYDDIHRQIKVLGNQENITYLNMLPFLKEDNANLNPNYYSNDGIHLKPPGYKVWGEHITK